MAPSLNRSRPTTVRISGQRAKVLALIQSLRQFCVGLVGQWQGCLWPVPADNSILISKPLEYPTMSAGFGVHLGYSCVVAAAN
jgi:hypothetical protein